MKKIVIISLAPLALFHQQICAKLFEFQIADEVPGISIKVETINKKNGSKQKAAMRVGAGKKNRSKPIDVIGADDIAVLSIQSECGESCDQMDEIYVAETKPEELSRREKNPSEEGPYVEKIRRYNQPNLLGKTKFKIGKGWGAIGFFQVDPIE